MAVLPYTANLAYWFAADVIPGADAMSLAQGTSGPGWEDVGLGLPLLPPTGVTGSQVQLKLNQVARKPAVQFQSSGNLVTASGLGLSASGATILLVARVDNVGNAAGTLQTNPAIISSSSSGGVSFALVCVGPVGSPTVTLVYENSGATFSHTPQIPIVLGSWHIYVMRFIAGAVTLGVDDWYVTGLSGASIINISNTLAAGANLFVGTVSNFLPCAIAEMLFYSVDLYTQTPNAAAAVFNYLASKYGSYDASGIGTTAYRGACLDQTRDTGSRRNWKYRRVMNGSQIVVPAQYADNDIMDDIALATPFGPDRAGAATKNVPLIQIPAGGWTQNPVYEAAHRITGVALDDNLHKVVLDVDDLRMRAEQHVDTLICNDIQGAMNQGELAFGAGVIQRFLRSSDRASSSANIAHPVSGYVVQIPRRAMKMTKGGVLLEGGFSDRFNVSPRGVMLAGLTGWTITGNTTGSVTADANPPFPVFEGALSFITANPSVAQSLKFVMGTTAADLDATQVATANIAALATANWKFRVFFDYFNDVQTGQLNWRLKDLSAGTWWNDTTGTWGVTHNNVLPLSPVGAYASFSSKEWLGSAINGTTGLSLEVFFPNGTTSGATAHLLCNEIIIQQMNGAANTNTFRRSRLLLDPGAGSEQTGEASAAAPDLLSFTDPLNNVLALAGGFCFDATPIWNPSDINTASGSAVVPLSGTYQWFLFAGGADFASGGLGHWLALRWNQSTGNLELLWNNNAGAYSPLILTATWTPAAGRKDRIGLRWTSPSAGELGKPGNTVSLFLGLNGGAMVNVAEGQLSGAPSGFQDPVYFNNAPIWRATVLNSRMGTAAADCPDAVIGNWRSMLFVKTDAEYAQMPT